MECWFTRIGYSTLACDNLIFILRLVASLLASQLELEELPAVVQNPVHCLFVKGPILGHWHTRGQQLFRTQGVEKNSTTRARENDIIGGHKRTKKTWV